MNDIREAVTAAVEQVSGNESAPAQIDTPAPIADAAPAESPGRARDEKGRFAAAETATEAVAPTPEAPDVPVAPLRKAPSSWKKDYWEAFGKLEPTLQDYIEQRERESAAGVSQYKQRAEALGTIEQAISPYMPLLQQHGIQPGQWIASLGEAHKTLVQGSPAQKLAMFAKLAQDYQVPLEHIQNPAVWSQLQPQQDPRAIVREELEQREAQSQIRAFHADVEAGKYPHYEAVREAMAGLLRAGLAVDLPSAYKQAVRMNDELHEAEIHQQLQARQEEAKQNALKAKATAVSVKSSAPTGPVADAGKPRDIRSTVSAAWDQHMGGRV